MGKKAKTVSYSRKIIQNNLAQNLNKLLFYLRSKRCIFAIGLAQPVYGEQKTDIAMVDDKQRLNARDKLASYLENLKLRKTPERFAILDIVLSFNAHFDAEALFKRMEEEAYHVSRATVYNTLDLLTDCGLLRKHRFGENSQSQYECVTDAPNHHHLICTECGKIKEIKDAELLKYLNLKKYSSFTTSYYVLYIYGICNACARRIRKENKINSKIK